MNTTWHHPDLSLTAQCALPAPEFPHWVLGKELGAWVTRAADACNAPSDYVSAALLTSAAAMIGNARRINAAGHAQPAILWTMLVGKPSSGKSPALKPFEEIISDIEAEIGAGLITAFDGPTQEPPHLSLTDVTPAAAAQVAAWSPKGLFHLNDEISGFIRKYREEPFWLKAFNGSAHTVVRKDKPKIFIKRLSVNMLGGCQPDPLRSMLTASLDQGFAARWLYIYPEARAYGAHVAFSAEVAAAALRRLASLELGEAGPIVLPLDTAVHEWMHLWNADMHERASQHEGIVAGWFGKMPGVALRLSLVLQHLWWASEEGAEKAPPSSVSSAAYEAATTLIDSYAAPMALRTMNASQLPEDEQDARVLLRLLIARRTERFNLREVRRGSLGALGALATGRRLEAACRVLSDACLVRHLGGRAGTTAGRPRSDFEVNPLVR